MIQTALIIFAIAGGAVTAASVYQKAEAFDGRITANEQHIAELRHGIDVLNQKQDLTMQFFGIRNNVK